MKKRKIHGRSSRFSQLNRALVLSDSSRLKAEEQKKCKTLYKKIEVARELIELHESQSVPEYQRWLHSHLGPQLTELRENAQKLSELQDLVEAVEAHCLYSGCSQWQAYASIIKLREKQAKIYEKMDSEPNFNRESNHQSKNNHQSQSRQDDESFQTRFDDLKNENAEDFEPSQSRHKHSNESSRQDPYQEEFYRSIFESFYGTKNQWRSRHQTYEDAFENFKEEIEDNHKQSQSKTKKKKNSPASPAVEPSDSEKDIQVRLKEYYRILVRKLHPDLNSNTTPKMKDLWHQVQNAYETQDLARLEALCAFNEMVDENLDKIDGISTLRKLFLELKSRLRLLEKKTRQAKKDKAWNFAQKLLDPQQLNCFERELKKEMNLQKEEFIDQIEELQYLINSWKNPTKRERSRKTPSLGLNSVFDRLF